MVVFRLLHGASGDKSSHLRGLGPTQGLLQLGCTQTLWDTAGLHCKEPPGEQAAS